MDVDTWETIEVSGDIFEIGKVADDTFGNNRNG